MYVQDFSIRFIDYSRRIIEKSPSEISRNFDPNYREFLDKFIEISEIEILDKISRNRGGQ